MRTFERRGTWQDGLIQREAGAKGRVGIRADALYEGARLSAVIKLVHWDEGLVRDPWQDYGSNSGARVFPSLILSSFYLH